MSKARNNENQKIESIEPLILMSASAADIGNVIDLTDPSVIIADDAHEAAVGTSGDDVIVGLGGDNCLHGEDGDDLFFTTSGNNNEVDGQGGTDTIRYLGNRSEFSVVALDGGGFMISDDADRVDRVYNVEKFEFNDGVIMAADLLSGNDAPVFTTGQHFMVPENTTDVTTVQATDADNDTLVYSLGTAGDSEFFDIDPNTGVLTFKNAPDFENPLDDNGDNVYDVFVKVTDGKTTTIQAIWVGVTDVNENGGENQSPFFTNVADGEMITVPENTTAVKDTDAMDPDGDTLTYSFSDALGTPGSGVNEDSGAFNIDPNTGVLSFKVAPDFENPGDADGDNEYLVTIVVQDGKGGAQERDVIVKVTDVNENGGGNNAPVFTNIPADKMVTVDENQTTAFDLAATDADAGDTLTYTITGGADAGLFDIDAATGVLTFKVAPDFEAPGDADGQNDYEVSVRVSDGTDFDDDNLIIKVGDVNENGGGNQDPFFTNVEQNEVVTVFEGNRFVGDANGQDPDGDTVSFSIVGGVDAARFIVDPATGVLSFVDTPDFENPVDADGNNEYLVTLQIADGKGGTQDRDVIVRVLNVVEGGGNRAPFFTNVEEGEMVTVVENNTLVGDANGFDPDGDAVIYSIAGGVDAALFTVDPATGVVSFINAPDFENPGDVGANNEYNITLRISDGTLSQDRNVVVKVLDANDGGAGNRNPFFTNVEEGEVVTVPENTTPVGDANAQDPDGDTVSFSIVGGADASLFTVDSVTGVVSFITAPDFEAPSDADGNNNYQITLRVSDGNGGTQDRNVTVRVTDVGNEGGGGGNQAPFFTNVSEAEVVTVPENTTPVGDANGIDPNGDAVTYSISGGADAALFTVNAQTGVVSFVNAPNFEAPGDADGNNNYQITLRISDGTLFQDRNVTVRVTDVGGEGGNGNNQAPFFTNVSQGEVVNVLTGTTGVGDANAVDPNGDAITYSISGGADAALFTVNAQTGVVSFINAPDVNNPRDADGNNSYLITLRASDGSLFQDRNVVVNVVANNQQGNRAPIFTNVSQGEVVWFDENGTFVGDANAIDLDGDVLTFSVVGGADAAKFQINAQTGELFFINAPDFENPGDANGNNLYELVIRVSDGTASVDRTIGVNVEDVNENGGNNGGGNNGNGGVNQVNQINLTNIFTQLLNGLSGVHPYSGPSIY